MTATASVNGTGPTVEKIEQTLTGEPLSVGYKPTLPLDTMWGPDGLMPFYQMRRDIEYMLWHPQVRTSLNYYRSGIAGAEFEIKCESPEIGKFILDQVKRYWDRGVPLLQMGDEYGWIAGENQYCLEDDDGLLKWESLIQFAPRDVFLLTKSKKPVGVRVKNVQDKGQVDLWLGSEGIPSKGMWYAHNPRYSQWYGQSQLLGAWRPWRRLAWKDGAETVLDGGVYRVAYQGPEVGYPDESYLCAVGTPGATQQPDGTWRRYARDMARQIGEQSKTGAAIGLCTAPYPKDVGGGPKWTLKWPTTVLNCDPILNYIKNLHDQISYGIGVPPELIQASETGSGYSGREIPVQAFLDGQQRNADAMLWLFEEQVLRPLVEWNFGKIRWSITCRRLLETKNKAKQGQAAGQPGQPNPGQPTQMEQPKPQQGAMFSMLITDHVRNIARKILRKAA